MFWGMRRLGLYPGECSVDLAEDTWGDACPQFTTASGLDKWARLGVSQVTHKKCAYENTGVKQNPLTSRRWHLSSLREWSLRVEAEASAARRAQP